MSGTHPREASSRVPDCGLVIECPLEGLARPVVRIAPGGEELDLLERGDLLPSPAVEAAA